MSAPTIVCAAQPVSGGGLARVGRAQLRADMTRPCEPGGCACARCSPPPLDDIEAARALRHVSNADAVAYAPGQLTLTSYWGCEGCGSWVPIFTEAAAVPR
ncbi:hypothetical protein [Mycolicibacterium sp. CR10]|uniref:hypothetical protein n=1 Tax=Mycolicibacterium sp. CR10 TaxID=2562314 RepID=UPI0010BFDD59|nr:hypothetical protein [Mycolicibacterium sp. CR10]